MRIDQFVYVRCIWTIVNIQCACAPSHVQLFCEPVDCSPSGSSVHVIFLVRILEWVATSSHRILPTQGSNPHLLHLVLWQTDSLPLHHLRSNTQ